jgi:hypothetical protein
MHRNSKYAGDERELSASGDCERYEPRRLSPMQKSLTMIFACVLAVCAANQSSADNALELMLMGTAPHPDLDPEEAARVAKSPLGSAQNPVRTEGPSGQRAYLMRLRCPEGRAPTFERGGSAGLSPYGSIMDVYRVACDAPPTHSIYMDLYHPGYVESEAVAGFSITNANGT